MEQGKDPIPVYRRGPDRKIVKKVEAVVKAFAKEMHRQAMMMVTEYGGVPEMPTVDDLLKLRTELIRVTDEGMLEQKDQEGKIGILAAMIWFLRLEESRQSRILEEWG